MIFYSKESKQQLKFYIEKPEAHNVTADKQHSNFVPKALGIFVLYSEL